MVGAEIFGLSLGLLIFFAVFYALGRLGYGLLRLIYFRLFKGGRPPPGKPRPRLRLFFRWTGAIVLLLFVVGMVLIIRGRETSTRFVRETAPLIQAECQSKALCPEIPTGFTAAGRGCQEGGGCTARAESDLTPHHRVFYHSAPDRSAFVLYIRYDIDCGVKISGGVEMALEEQAICDQPVIPPEWRKFEPHPLPATPLPDLPTPPNLNLPVTTGLVAGLHLPH
ncbi:MAG: hypothetical protein HQL52_04585 [Magnetococcales bacterium]|nr:hypothetical protein [Magnetococcales bacterium]